MPIILISASIGIFIILTSPIYNDISTLNAQVASYDTALDNSKALENQRDMLVAKENSISVENMDRLEKFLPQNVDNIRLILEIEEIAKPYGMTLKDIKYDAAADKSTTGNTAGTPVVQGGRTAEIAPKDYGIFNLEFSTTGTYVNFVNFTKALESNLRVVDISSISFSSDSFATSGTATGVSTNMNSSEIYKYNFSINTYWLKN
ncbi:MAG: hypothetical protein WC609_00420 [Candidatus Paceibacterota bacterium]|jgi:Tfp pilus assembly protein PilO